MKTYNIFISIAALSFCIVAAPGTANAQFLNKLKNAAKTAAKEVVKEEANRVIDKHLSVDEDDGTFATDQFSVFVPEGWKAFTFTPRGRTTGVDPRKVAMHKGNQLSTPGLTILYFRPNQTMPSDNQDFEDIEDLEPLEIGDLVYEGFSYVQSDLAYMQLRTENAEGHKFQVTILLEKNGEQLSVDDPDVQEILESLKPVEKK